MTRPDPALSAPLSAAEVRAFSERRPGPGLVRAASHFGAILATGALIWWVSGRYGLLLALPLMLLQGFFIAFLFMALHEAAHRTVFTSRRANLALGHLSGFLIVFPYEYYQLFHWDHHRYTQDPERDPELVSASIPRSDTRLAIAYTGIVQLVNRIRLHLRHALTGRVRAPWVPEKKRGRVVAEVRLYMAGYLALIAGSVAFGSGLLLWVWAVPLVLGQLFLRPYLYAEHTGCEHTRSAYENTRTTYTAALVRWFAWNMPYHVEHHAYPSVPFHALPALNTVISGRIRHPGRGYRAVTRQTWAWFRAARGGRA
ncbi:fatty acid desaturase [Oceanicella sp. SM1341]|uniref:fatty acid desaturase n=1 Tax=Oceanicella sp. SM1341 TaxID=1548889 RepID=UPI000E4ACF79|nr:fatty acid desaturase [Oceanicella sp. SM1341]